MRTSQRGQFSTSKREVREREERWEEGEPSSRMTLSPKTLTSIAPRDHSTRRVRISRIGFERALMSMAHIPRVTGGRGGS